jgi:predicted lactoylglutathione lyase
MIYVNLPISNIANTRKFWTNLGFSFNEQHSNDKALCLILSEGLVQSMLMTTEFFKTFTNRPLYNGTTTQVLTALDVDSKEQVDKIITLAIENGGTRYTKNAANYGSMYYDCFADLDGHQWEIIFNDISLSKTK